MTLIIQSLRLTGLLYGFVAPYAIIALVCIPSEWLIIKIAGIMYGLVGICIVAAFLYAVAYNALPNPEDPLATA